MNNTSTPLEGLRERRRQLTEAKAAQSEKQREASRAITALDKDLDAVNAEIQRLNPVQIRVSDHAVIQFCARTMGLDVDSLRERVLPTDPRVLTAIATLGSGTYGAGTHRCVVKQNTIVTVLPLD